MKRRSNTLKARRLLRFERGLSSLGYELIAGVDEAGRGSLAGPVVAGAVILKERRFTCEIDDSKKLSAPKREAAYKEILDKAIVGVGIVSEKTIDEINIYRATLKAMELAIADLDIPPDYIIVDGRMKVASKCPVECVIRGDSKCMSIACASIIAKVTRDKLMREYDGEYPRYGFARHKGYGTIFHIEALKKFGPSPIHRLSFRPMSGRCK